MQITTLPPAKDSEARERLLSTATAIFYAEGINSVGVDRIVSASNVTRATFYRHFPSKQDLVLAYLQTVHDAIEARQIERAAAHDEPQRLLAAVGADICAQIETPGFRGCAFICAAAEFEDRDNPVSRAIRAHRDWFFGVVRDAFGAAGHPQPEDAARRYVMLRDGAMVGGHLGDPAAAAQTFRRSVDGLLRFADEPA
ncbi:TetR/AcrR family transcriptional regulator [Conexibacter sp. CPCC 206217]|uniref:TetR/AcrR family transcriptional regulator n=1 Tax=Conexibacter sp. CPCC 206217 TaxID=3064574 RepID=UPI002726C10C|nr:TetR/AcrR family transcriptional regulator [Conexibacter sp. CPCC 206217]MDO8209050.1 TetR/AcrR family transcriptional regulator [Conexibacter sp. CPCC 206217]